MEDEPVIHIRIDGEETDVTRDNGTLFTFVGKTALSGGFEVDSANMNHVFITDEVNDNGTVSGSYIFAASEAFEAVRDFMMENGYPLHLNLREVAECDVNAYEVFLKQQSDDLDTIPEGW